MFEYKVIPAPRTAQKAKGAKGISGRFSATLQTALNELGADGWSYVRAETLPVEERQGLLRKRVEDFQTVLIFSRPLAPRPAAALTPEPGPEPRRPVFFSPKSPEVSSAPALGPATGEDKAATPEIKAEKPDTEATEAEPDEQPTDAAPKSPARKRVTKAKK